MFGMDRMTVIVHHGVKLAADAVVESAGLDDVAQTGGHGDVVQVECDGLSGRGESGNFQPVGGGALANVEAIQVEFVNRTIDEDWFRFFALDADGGIERGLKDGGFAKLQVDERDVQLRGMAQHGTGGHQETEEADKPDQ